MASARVMRILAVKRAAVSFPTGDKNFSVMQAFPAGFTAEEADPFLMMDHFGPKLSTGKLSDPDKFPVGWHPHRGMDIMTYLISGTGRHADSLGNRGEFKSPGAQWISVGSGIEHAEGGGSPEGSSDEGFQIWINVPSQRKMDDPKYGTIQPEDIPLIMAPGVSGRLLAGLCNKQKGPFETVQSVQIVDYELESGATITHSIPDDHDNCIVYIYKGQGTVGGIKVTKNDVIRLDGSDPALRDVVVTNDSSSNEKFGILVFAGKMIGENIAWHGPFVMNTDAEIQKTIAEYRNGTFLKRRVDWDYKRIATKPKSAEEL